MDSNRLEIFNRVKDKYYVNVWRMFCIGMQFQEVCLAHGIPENEMNFNEFNPMFALIDEICTKDFEGTRIFFEGEQVL